jgi:MoaA/NifB/PqqE/SkfB family radical SAM enzyme
LKLVHLKNHRTLDLILTYRCNAAYEICCNDYGAHRNEDMEPEDAINFIDQAKKAGFRRIGITGGEPFLFINKILKIAEFCRYNDLFLGCLTNAYWA